jgi:phenylpyruvate tautomerase PptA (4-oxalocrotonate tautomerase family)
VISEEAKIPKQYVWAVIDEVVPRHWFVGGRGGDVAT